jgi:hypothetical protein
MLAFIFGGVYGLNKCRNEQISYDKWLPHKLFGLSVGITTIKEYAKMSENILSKSFRIRPITLYTGLPFGVAIFHGCSFYIGSSLVYLYYQEHPFCKKLTDTLSV